MLGCENAVEFYRASAIAFLLGRKMKARILTVCSGMLLGAFLVGVPIYLRGLLREQHYCEIERFFEGTVGNRKVIGISFFEYSGFRPMELNKWKVVMQEEGCGEPVILYEEAACFQESIPHQPTIQIEGNVIFINDGIRILRISVEESKRPNKALNRDAEDGAA